LTASVPAADDVSGARTDLISNHTVFRHNDDFRALLRAEALPADTYSSFIHEATHHWCFMSPLGKALSLLYLSIAKRALHWVATGDESQTQEILNDLCAFDIAVSWLRPLNEGLALFAEYDIRPCENSEHMSVPLDAAMLHVFQVRQRLAAQSDRSELSYQLADDLCRWRLSRQTIERKSELLLQPMRVAGNAYLLGYLTVKQLWRNASRFYPELREPDLFLIFLRRIVFSDFSLIALLLDREKPATQRGLLFGQKLFERLHALRVMAFENDFTWADIERVIASPEVEHLPDLADVADPELFVFDSETSARRGMQLRGDLLEEVLLAESPEDLGGVEFPNHYFLNVLNERKYMWLGDVSGRWISTGRMQGRIVVDDGVVYDDLKLTDASDEGLDELHLDIYLDLYNRFQVTAVGSDRGVFAFLSRDVDSRERGAAMLKAKFDRREIVRVTELLRQVVASVTYGVNYDQRMTAFWSDPGYRLLEATYVGFAVDHDDAARSMLCDTSLATVLERDGRLVRDVAAISLAASAQLSVEGLVTMSSGVALEPEQTLARVASLWHGVSFPLAEIGEDGFLRSAI
jgi:hypothetical protein